MLMGRKNMKSADYILGINTTYHELSACLIKDGELIAAVEEERFNRIKHGKKALINNPNSIPYQNEEIIHLSLFAD